MKWKDYEEQVYREFREKYPDLEILPDQLLPGRHSKVPRQVDVLVRGHVADVPLIGVFDCKCFAEKVDVTTIDAMVGFIDDVGAQFGGVVTTVGFTPAAVERALGAAKIHLRTIEFLSVEQVVEMFIPSADFSDPRNSGLLSVLL